MTTPAHRVWQRLPQGWIEFIAHGERSPDEWLEWYLTSSEGWMSDEGRASVTSGFRSGVAAFADSALAFAGVSIILGERPSVSFLGTQVVTDTSDGASASFHRLFPLARFGTESTAEAFTSPDSRVGTVTRGTLDVDGREWLLAIGEIPLPDDLGTVLVTGIGSDPEQSLALSMSVAFALITTQYLADGETPGDLAMYPAANA
ncbi:MAG: hypothetical protein LBU78_05635 [Microbacterium sp.]|jgi:hypothetical protein|nr:hypothetical protein [Microbacterium sp.]